MAYVDGYVLPVPSAKLDDYKRMARKAGKVWKEHGALAYVEVNRPGFCRHSSAV